MACNHWRSNVVTERDREQRVDGAERAAEECRRLEGHSRLVIRRKGPRKNLEAVDFATLEWVDWFNHRRLLEPIGYVPPAEYEARAYSHKGTLFVVGFDIERLTTTSPPTPFLENVASDATSGVALASAPERPHLSLMVDAFREVRRVLQTAQ
jgi:hypothetical protein